MLNDEDRLEQIYDGWEAVKSCAQDIVGADTNSRASTHSDRMRMLASAKACVDTLLVRYEGLNELLARMAEQTGLSQGS